MVYIANSYGSWVDVKARAALVTMWGSLMSPEKWTSCSLYEAQACAGFTVNQPFIWLQVYILMVWIAVKKSLSKVR